MKYIRTYESFKNKSKQSVNEEFLGSLFKKLKNSLSMGFSKMFGSAADVDKIIEEYEKELKEKLAPSIKAYSNYATLNKRLKDGDITEEDAKKEMDNELNNIKKETGIYEKQKEIIKNKFNLRIKDAIEDEDNKKIKNYVNLKKLELQQRLIQYEIKEISDQTGLSEQELNNIKKISEKLKKDKEIIVDIQKKQKEESNAIENKDEEKPEIKEGDTVEYKSEKDETKTFTNKVKSVSEDEVEIETTDSGTIKRKIVDVKKVEGENEESK